MSCKTFNLKSCEIRGATYQGRKIDFVNKVITQDVFTAKVYDTQGYLLTEIIGIKSGSVVYFPFTAIQNLSKDKYRIKYWADFYLLGTILLGEEELTIGNSCPNCEVDDSTIPFVLELGTETIDFTLQLVYIAIGGDGGGEVDLSEYLKRVDADELYASKNHTHSYNDLTDLPPIRSIDSVISIGDIIATENNVLLEVHSSGYNKVYIDNQTYYKETQDNFPFTPITNGIKVLIIYASPNSQIFYLAEGVEATEAVEPAYNGLFVARLIVSTTGVDVETESSIYATKAELNKEIENRELEDAKKAEKDASNIDYYLEIWRQKIDSNYTHDQAQPSSIWTINHPLNKKVSVTITDTAGTVVEGSVTINDGNKVVIEFNFPFSGEAILN